MTDQTLRQFGLHLARLRKQRGWSQETLSLESGLARSYLSGIERGKRNLALLNICMLADTLGVPPSQMLDFPKHGNTATQVEEPHSVFGNAQNAAIEATLRHMAELNDAEVDVVAAVARALARKGNYRQG